MRKILNILPTQITFWHLVYQISTGIPWRIAAAAVPFVIFATITGLSWWKGLKAIYLKQKARKEN